MLRFVARRELVGGLVVEHGLQRLRNDVVERLRRVVRVDAHGQRRVG
jgi:hypothetical protein